MQWFSKFGFDGGTPGSCAALIAQPQFKTFLCSTVTEGDPKGHDDHPCLRSCGICTSLADIAGGGGAGGGASKPANLTGSEPRRLNPDSPMYPYVLKSVDLIAQRNLITTGDANVVAGGALELTQPFYSALKAMPPVLGAQWTLAADFQQSKGGRGYLLAKSRGSDSSVQRLYAIYSNSRGLTFYYSTPAGAARSLRFKVAAVNDGRRHQVVLWRWKRHIYLAVDGGKQVREQLDADGAIADCDRQAVSSCSFHVGQRKDREERVAWSLDGTIHSMTIVSNKVVRDYPRYSSGTVTQAQLAGSVDYLDPAVHNSAAQLRLGGHLFTPRRPGLSLGAKSRSTSAKLALSDKLSLAIRFRLVAGTGGYLFAKTSQHGAVKHLAVYVSPYQRDVAVYCTMGGKARSSRFKINLADGGEYRLLLTVRGATVRMMVDDVVVGGARTLGGAGSRLTDCDLATADCAAFIGQRVRAPPPAPPPAPPSPRC